MTEPFWAGYVLGLVTAMVVNVVANIALLRLLRKRADGPQVATCSNLMPSVPTIVTNADCGCPANHVCMNVACPRRMTVTS